MRLAGNCSMQWVLEDAGFLVEYDWLTRIQSVCRGWYNESNNPDLLACFVASSGSFANLFLVITGCRVGWWSKKCLPQGPRKGNLTLRFFFWFWGGYFYLFFHINLRSTLSSSKKKYISCWDYYWKHLDVVIKRLASGIWLTWFGNPSSFIHWVTDLGRENYCLRLVFLFGKKKRFKGLLWRLNERICIFPPKTRFYFFFFTFYVSQ